MYNSEYRPTVESDPSSKYGFFCDIEEETEIVKYYVIRKYENREITYEVKRSIAKSPSMNYLTMHHRAELHPGYSSERLCAAAAAAADDPSSFMDDLKYRAKSSYKRYKSKFRACFYSAIVCSMFIVSIYISVFMPIQ